MTTRLAPLLVLVCLLFPAGRLAAQDAPPELQGQAVLYPGSTLLAVKHFPKAVIVAASTQAGARELIAFYQKDMTQRGWSFVVADETAETAFLKMMKGPRQFLVEIQKNPGGATRYNLSL